MENGKMLFLKSESGRGTECHQENAYLSVARGLERRLPHLWVNGGGAGRLPGLCRGLRRGGSLAPRGLEDGAR